MLLQQSIPTSWTQTRITPIHKNGPTDIPSNYRPISVINQLTKILTALMASRLQKWAEVNQLIQEEQNAFREKRSTNEHIFVLKLLIDIRLMKNAKLYIAFVDIEKAYDSVDHDLHWE